MDCTTNASYHAQQPHGCNSRMALPSYHNMHSVSNFPQDIRQRRWRPLETILCPFREPTNLWLRGRKLVHILQPGSFGQQMFRVENCKSFMTMGRKLGQLQLFRNFLMSFVRKTFGESWQVKVNVDRTRNVQLKKFFS